MRSRRLALLFPALTAALVLSALLGLAMGSARLGFGEVAQALAGGKGGVVNGEFPPCGVCRQVMAEFCSPEFPVLFVVGDGKYTEHTLGEILPNAFYPNFVTN